MVADLEDVLNHQEKQVVNNSQRKNTQQSDNDQELHVVPSNEFIFTPSKKREIGCGPSTAKAFSRMENTSKGFSFDKIGGWAAVMSS